MTNSVSSPPLSALDDIPPYIAYEPVLDNLLEWSGDMKRWHDEAAKLHETRSNRQLTRAERSRLADLNSAMDTYCAYLENVGPMPDQPWIRRANKPGKGLVR